MSTPAVATEMIVIVEREEYRVPKDTKIDDLRQHLAAMFPNIGTASVQKGTRTIEGVQYETVEFVKRAGTKGASGQAIVDVLQHTTPLHFGRIAPRVMALLDKTIRGTLTVDEALDADLIAVLNALPDTPRSATSGGSLCTLLDTVPAMSADAPTAW